MASENPYQPPAVEEEAGLATEATPPTPVKTRWQFGPCMLLFMACLLATVVGCITFFAGLGQMFDIWARHRGTARELFEIPLFLGAAGGAAFGASQLFAAALFFLSARFLWKQRWIAFAVVVLGLIADYSVVTMAFRIALATTRT